MNKTNFKVLAMATIMLLLGNGAYLNAQVTVGKNTTPAATLDVIVDDASTTLAGVIAPRVERTYLNSNNYTSDQTGAIVYVKEATTGSTAGQAVNVNAIGYYYFDGALWQPLGSSSSSRFIIKTLSTGAPYTVTAADEGHVLFTTAATTITFSPLTAAEAGLYVYVFNNSGSTNTYNGPINGGQPAHSNGCVYIWSGSAWFAQSKQ